MKLLESLHGACHERTMVVGLFLVSDALSGMASLVRDFSVRNPNSDKIKTSELVKFGYERSDTISERFHPNAEQ